LLSGSFFFFFFFVFVSSGAVVPCPENDLKGKRNAWFWHRVVNFGVMVADSRERKTAVAKIRDMYLTEF
jgi:hypothetical protein